MHRKITRTQIDSHSSARKSGLFDRDNPVAPREGKVRKRRSQTWKSRLEAEGTKPRQREREGEKQVAERQSQANPDTRGRLCLTDQENRRGGGERRENTRTDWREGEGDISRETWRWDVRSEANVRRKNRVRGKRMERWKDTKLWVGEEK